MVSPGNGSAGIPPAQRLPHAFATRPRGAQIGLALVGPAVLGAFAGWLLGVSPVAYWVVQAVAAAGGYLAGLEHDGAREGAVRGVIGGAIFGACILLVHALTGAEAKVSLGAVPALLVVITAVLGSGLGALGGAGRRRATRG